MDEEDKLTIGGYAQIDYNQPLGNGALRQTVLKGLPPTKPPTCRKGEAPG